MEYRVERNAGKKVCGLALLSFLFTGGLMYCMFIFLQSSSQLSPNMENTHSLGHLEAKRAFDFFTLKHRRSYSSEKEKEERFNIFSDNLAKINSFNAKSKGGGKLGINKFGDMNEEEFRRYYTGHSPSPQSLRQNLEYQPLRTADYKLKDEVIVDWVTAPNKLSPVKDQSMCGSCWTFSTIEAVENVHAIATDNLTIFSEQDLVDCNHIGDSKGCNGGHMTNGFKYIIQQGIATEFDYPYIAMNSVCKTNVKRLQNIISSYVEIPASDNDALLKALMKNVVSIAVNAPTFMFRFYEEGNIYIYIYIYIGIINHACYRGDLDHAVLLVGAGVKEGQPYWRVRNSWGPNWGQDGDIYIYRDSTNRPALCGMNLVCSYPVV